MNQTMTQEAVRKINLIFTPKPEAGIQASPKIYANLMDYRCRLMDEVTSRTLLGVSGIREHRERNQKINCGYSLEITLDEKRLAKFQEEINWLKERDVRFLAIATIFCPELDK
jgi:hypothetical protein